MQQQDTLAMSFAAWMGCWIYLKLSIGFGSGNRMVKIVRSSLISVCAVVRLNQNPVKA